MSEPSIPFLLTIPAVLLLLGSSIVTLKKKKGREGSIEMLLGSFLMFIAIIGSYGISYYFSSNQYSFEANQEFYYMVSDVIINLHPIGLVLLSVGIARYTKLFPKLGGRVSV